MRDAGSDFPPRRTGRARAGIVALNLLAPGLGLLRVGAWPAGVAFLTAPVVLLIGMTYAIGHLPISSHERAVGALLAVLALLASLYIAPMVATWRLSRFRRPLRSWSRWYALLAVVVVANLLSQSALSLMHRFYKPFFAPSASMAPTIDEGDKFITDMRWRGPVSRGDIIVFRNADGMRVSRVAALAGDRIAMRGGVPILNGTMSPMRRMRRRVAVTDLDGRRPAEMLTERLPGEASDHRVLDLGPSPLDDMTARMVPAGHVFVLGDNRDRSADSRVAVDLDGVGMVPLAAIVGRPMYIHWSHDRTRIGTRLDQ